MTDVPFTIRLEHAMRLTTQAELMAGGDARKAVAMLVHALAGTLVLSLDADAVEALRQDPGAEFGPVLADALVTMGKVSAEAANYALAKMRTEGQA